MASFSAFLSGIALHSISFEAPTSLPFGIFSPYTYKEPVVLLSAVPGKMKYPLFLSFPGLPHQNTCYLMSYICEISSFLVALPPDTFPA
jgi:hypothetical protein